MKLTDRISAKWKAYVERQLQNLANNIASSSFLNSSAVAQKKLMMSYKQLAQTETTLNFRDVGFSEYSQTDEDGILLYIFSIAGSETRKCVEICAADGIECNTSNLIINHGWHGLLVDGNSDLVKKGQAFYKQHKNTYVYPPKFVNTWVTHDNINLILEQEGFTGEIDLLSLDMDGVDYWILDAINVISPRVIVLEYQDILGPDKCWTVPYSDSFDRSEYPHTQGMPNFCGASLSAFNKLLVNRGYRLVGTNRLQYNAFFIKNSIAETQIPTIRVNECFTHEKVKWGMVERFPSVRDLPWEQV